MVRQRVTLRFIPKFCGMGVRYNLVNQGDVSNFSQRVPSLDPSRTQQELRITFSSNFSLKRNLSQKILPNIFDAFEFGSVPFCASAFCFYIPNAARMSPAYPGRITSAVHSMHARRAVTIILMNLPSLYSEPTALYVRYDTGQCHYRHLLCVRPSGWY